MIRDISWKPSKVVGSLLMFFGCFPFVLWFLHQIGYILPEGAHPLGEWAMILVTIAMCAIGWMLWAGQGASVASAFLGWFGKKSDGSG